MPEVSIILPTYNRVDVIGRAVASILLQTHQDWELLVIDDGSNDGTVERLDGLDPRIRFIRQANQGVATARNTGIAAATGRFIAFMDSDDEWRPQFLALTTAFLRAHPDEHWVATESLEDLGDGGPPIRHSCTDIATTYVAFARSIGSRALDLPPGTRDDYLRVYQRCAPVGAWGRAVLDAIGLDCAMVYHGHTLQHMRWGYLNWLPATLLTREALATAGPFATHVRSASDYRYFIALARHFPANLIAVPLAIKYERAMGNQVLAQDHLATGAGAYRFERNKLACLTRPSTRTTRRSPCCDATTACTSDTVHWSAVTGTRPSPISGRPRAGDRSSGRPGECSRSPVPCRHRQAPQPSTRAGCGCSTSVHAWPPDGSSPVSCCTRPGCGSPAERHRPPHSPPRASR